MCGAWEGWCARGAGTTARACGGGGWTEAAVAHSGKNPIRNKTGLDDRGVGGAAHGGGGEGVGGVVVDVFGGITPGCLGAREQAGEQQEDQRFQPRGKAHAHVCGVGPEAGAQACYGGGLGGWENLAF